MNSLLQVKMRFNREKNPQKPGARNLRVHAMTDTEKIDSLILDLESLLGFYHSKQRLTNGILVEVHYNDIIAKSNRIQALLKPHGGSPNDAIVGARFSNETSGEEKHIITYYIPEDIIQETIENLRTAKSFLLSRLNGKATYENFKEPNSNIDYSGYNIKKNKIRDVIIDCSVVNSFNVPRIDDIKDRNSYVITFYKTELSVTDIFRMVNSTSIYTDYGDNTIAGGREILDLLNEKVPYLISMVSSDLSMLNLEDVEGTKIREERSIPAPQNEPTIGVIDTVFDDNVYFHDWVESHDYTEDYEKYTSRNNINHGTHVSSIIVDGPRLNPLLEDNCGRFRVRHFGVCHDRISPSRLVRRIQDIVSQNPDIHVWNLSLGTDEEISKNFISYDSSILDAIQSSYNVLFVISGTNDRREVRGDLLRVGSPADSLNSIIVNSVKFDGTPASYSRKGTVLSFFNKPDVAYYGGDTGEPIIAYDAHGEAEVSGTSFAAPWISRKLCFLIDVLGLPREVAKATIIDSAAGWKYKFTSPVDQELKGYGIVPIKIEQVVESNNDEIRFTIYGSSESYKTANYSIPVPKDEDGKYPYIARATLCYFPPCSRAQGVDYTNRELSLKFGRVKPNGTIADINKNVQDEKNKFIDERKSRKEFRKWENTKFISSLLKNNRPSKSYEERLWGFSITSKERLTNQLEKPLNFGAVITLKEISGKNRIQDFIRACELRNWIVTKVDIENKIELYQANQEDIIFD